MIRVRDEARGWPFGAAARARLTALAVVAAMLAVAGEAQAVDDRISGTAGLICAIDERSEVVCWGEPGYDLRRIDGHPGGSGAFTVPGVDDAVGVSVADENACVLDADGEVLCWGTNASGSIGAGDEVRKTVPVRFGAIDDAIDVAAGDRASCAVRADRTVWCAGSQSYNSIGDQRHLTPVSSPALAGAAEVAASGMRYCARLEAGGIRCWGSGWLGDGSEDPSTTPVVVVGIGDATDIAVGDAHACAVVGSGQVRCWGENGSGQLGDGTTISRAAPVAVPGVVDAVEVAANGHVTCVRRSNGRVACWGTGKVGQLGRLAFDRSATPIEIPGVDDARGIAAAAMFRGSQVWRNGTLCALRRSGEVACWGDNWRGELGNGAAQTISTPRAMEGVSGATAVTIGVTQSCVIVSGGGVRCSGGSAWAISNADYHVDEYTGLLGHGAVRLHSPVPIAVPGLSGVRDIASDGHVTCAITAARTVSCWGLNAHSVLGTADAAARGPAVIGGIAEATDIAVGGNPMTSSSQSDGGRIWACAVADGRVLCWGGETRLGDGTAARTSAAPVAVEANGVSGGPATVIEDATRVAVSRALGYDGSPHGAAACLVRSGGTVWCWGALPADGGAGTSGELGRATQVAGLSGAIDIAVGQKHACALLATGGIRCWGFNSLGSLGNGVASASSTVPVAVANVGAATSFGQATAIDAGGDRTCAAFASGAVACWGPLSGFVTRSPSAIAGAAGAVAVAIDSSGERNAVCWTTRTGLVECRGTDRAGALGSRAAWSEMPEPVIGFTGPRPPGQAIIVAARAGDGSITVTWSAPGEERPVTRYVVEASPGDRSCVWTEGPLTCTLTGLENGRAYTLRVRAENAIGEGAWSPETQSTPFGVPDAPASTGLSLGRTIGYLAASWGPIAERGRPIEEIEVELRAIRDDRTAKEPGRVCHLEGSAAHDAAFRGGTCRFNLGVSRFGRPHEVRVRARNAVGWGAWSEWSQPFTPRTRPTEPGIRSVQPGDGRALVVWEASYGPGAPVTEYRVCVSMRPRGTSAPVSDPCARADAVAGCAQPAEDDERWGTTAYACVVEGLRNGAYYDVVVRARNRIGWSSDDWATVTPSTRVPSRTTASGAVRVPVSCPRDAGCTVRVRMDVAVAPFVFRSPWVKVRRGTTQVEVALPENVREQLAQGSFQRATVAVETIDPVRLEYAPVIEMAAPPAERVATVVQGESAWNSPFEVGVGVPCEGGPYTRCSGYFSLLPPSGVRAGRALARVRFSVRGGETAQVVVRLNAAGRRLLRERGELVLQPRITTVGGTAAPTGLAPMRFVSVRPGRFLEQMVAVDGALERDRFIAIVLGASGQRIAWSDAAERLRREVLPAQRRAVGLAEALPRSSPALRRARRLAIMAARRQVRATEGYAAWFEADRLDRQRQGARDDRQARAWMREALALAEAETRR